MNNKSRFAVVLLASAVIGTGCIHTEQTEYRDEPRLKVEFENDAAGRMFYEGLSKMRQPQRQESSTEVSLPIVFHHKHRTVEGENIAFNQAVRRCDTNGDGRITELEAKIFVENVSKAK